MKLHNLRTYVAMYIANRWRGGHKGSPKFGTPSLWLSLHPHCVLLEPLQSKQSPPLLIITQKQELFPRDTFIVGEGR